MNPSIRQGGTEPGPMFFVVYEIEKPSRTFPEGVWTSRGYWHPGSANRRASHLKAKGLLAFVEAR